MVGLQILETWWEGGLIIIKKVVKGIFFNFVGI